MSDKIVCPLCYSNIYPEHEGTCPKCHHHVETAPAEVEGKTDRLTSLITFDAVGSHGTSVAPSTYIPDQDPFTIIGDILEPSVDHYRKMWEGYVSLPKIPHLSGPYDLKSLDFLSTMNEILGGDWRYSPRPEPVSLENRTITADFDSRHPGATLSEDGRYIIMDLEDVGVHKYLKHTRGMMGVPFSRLQGRIDEYIGAHLDKQRVATLREEYPQLSSWSDDDILAFADTAHMQMKNRSYKG